MNTTLSDGIYLDNNATTRVDERVIEAVVDAMRHAWGNPSSLHGFGEVSSTRVEDARGRVARLLGAGSPDEILFTSGGTESINTALFAALSGGSGGSCLTSATEHAVVGRPLDRLSASGVRIVVADVDADGRIDVAAFVDRIPSDCRLVTIHWANNETGAVLEDDEVARIAERCRSLGVLFHLDAVQIPGKRPIAMRELGVDLASISAHKFHGPKGVGALFVRTGAFDGAFPALFAGGSQERDRRAGTHNVPGIVGLGRAADLARAHVDDPAACATVRGLRDALEEGLLAAISGASVHAALGARLDNTSSVHIPDVDGELLLASLAAVGIAVSGGAACSAATRGPSPVLLAMGLGEDVALETVRFSLSRFTTDQDVHTAVKRVSDVVTELRDLEAV